MHGNVGSAFRQRAQIFIFLFIFSAAGMYMKKCARAGISNELLLQKEPDDVDAPAATPAGQGVAQVPGRGAAS
jgi:hypothetical protein